MGGKASLLLVLAFSITFLIAGFNFSNLATGTVDNSAEYFTWTRTHNAAVSGAQIALGQIFTGAGINTPDYTNTLSIDGFTVNLELKTINPDERHKQLTASLNYTDPLSGRDYNELVTAEIIPSFFSRFAYFSNSESLFGQIRWVSEDVVNGPMYTNDVMLIDGTPTFNGLVTNPMGWTRYRGSTGDPVFNGGYASGPVQEMPASTFSDLKLKAEANGAYIDGSKIGNNRATLTFTGEKVIYERDSIISSYYDYWGRLRTVTQSLSTEYKIGDFTQNRVIYADDAQIRVKGIVDGKVTIVASGGQTTGKGNIYLDGDLTCDVNPLTDQSSNDFIGLVAEQSVWISDNLENNHNDINIHASIFCQDGGFGAENYSSRGYEGKINLVGGIIQNARRAVGTGGGTAGSISNGFKKNYQYDNRFMTKSPPEFPTLAGFSLQGWCE